MDKFIIDNFIASIKDFPKKGILFRDISPLLASHYAMSNIIKKFQKIALNLENQIDYIAGIESRGFLFSTLLADKLEIGSIMLRKPGKTPGDFIQKTYTLEYGNSSLTLKKSLDLKNKNIIIIDDLIATGGSLSCAESLFNEAGARVLACFVVIELTELKGKKALASQLYSLKKY
jgi:adenine phosphoribosyltransferase